MTKFFWKIFGDLLVIKNYPWFCNIWFHSNSFPLDGSTIWEKVFKSGPSKICGRQPLKTSNILKVVFHKFYFVHSWILCPIHSALIRNGLLTNLAFRNKPIWANLSTSITPENIQKTIGFLIFQGEQKLNNSLNISAKIRRWSLAIIPDLGKTCLKTAKRWKPSTLMDQFNCMMTSITLSSVLFVY